MRNRSARYSFGLGVALGVLAVACGHDGGSADASRCGPGASDIVLRTATGDLNGTLELPDGCAPFPLVLIHAGSGPTDRDGNQPPAAPGSTHSDALKLLAEGLAGRGIASVRYDKRGVAASAGALSTPAADLTIEVYVDDLVAWTRELKSDERFDGLTIAGHSEGSLIGMLAAEQEPPRAFVSLEGAGRPAAAVLREQLPKSFTGPALDEANAVLDQLEQGRRVDAVPKEVSGLFGPSVQTYFLSWFAYDPAQEIAKVAGSILIVQGTADIQVGAVDAQLLAGGNAQAELVTLEGMNHVLKLVTPDDASQQRAYHDPSLPLAPGLVDAVARVAQPPTR